MNGLPTDHPVTMLLGRMRAGDEDAAEDFYVLVYEELRRLAGAHLRRTPPGATLQPTALVHEAWLRLVKDEDAEWKNRDHFLAVAALAMRHTLVDATRQRMSAKRGGGHQRVPLEDVLEFYEERACNLVELDDALTQLASRNERQAKIVELRFFGGLTIEEAARVIGVGIATVERDWHLARIWLRHALPGE